VPSGSHRQFPFVRKAKLIRLGRHLALRIPKKVAHMLRLTAGAEVEIVVCARSFALRKAPRKWSEAELLRGVTPRMAGGEVDWGHPVGREVM